VDDGAIVGRGTKIWHFCHVLPGTVIGEDCSIGQNVMIGPRVKIGNGCKIQNNVSLYDGVELADDVFCGPSCVFTNVNNPRANVSRKDEFRTTPIGRGASIGANATIVCGHKLGEYCFIGAGAVVTKDVPEGAVMVGIPARSTLLDASEYAREFVPYGTPCSETFDPATQRVEMLQCQLDLLQKQLKSLLDERDIAENDEVPRRKGTRKSA
jgi:UDP-2-acetamido-3-amino-2,3-dideoxy-glucuronate N-acetyltransferase